MSQTQGIESAPPASGGGWVRQALALLALLFGLATLTSGGSVVLNLGDARQSAGAVVPLVVWFNTLAGLAYVAAGLGLWRRRPWAAHLAVGIAAATALVFALLLLMIVQGVPYEPRTIGAMVFRLGVWTLLALYMRRVLLPRPRA